MPMRDRWDLLVVFCFDFCLICFFSFFSFYFLECICSIRHWRTHGKEYMFTRIESLATIVPRDATKRVTI